MSGVRPERQGLLYTVHDCIDVLKCLLVLVEAILFFCGELMGHAGSRTTKGLWGTLGIGGWLRLKLSNTQDKRALEPSGKCLVPSSVIMGRRNPRIATGLELQEQERKEGSERPRVWAY